MGISEKNVKCNLVSNVQALLLKKRAFVENPLTEQQIADHFGVSRTPVRDALKTIETDGLIHRVQGKGVYLKRPSAQDVIEVYDLRTVMEAYAGPLAAQNRTDKDIVELSSLAAAITQAKQAKDLKRADKADIALHTLILKLSGNSLLIRQMEGLRMISDSMSLAYDLGFIDPHEENPASHAAIVAAIRDRKSEQTERLLRAHVEYAQKTVLRLVSNANSTRV